MIAYVDASVLLRIAFGQPDSLPEWSKIERGVLIASLELVDVDSIVLDRAAQPMPTEIGTLAAIHLATALLWQDMAGEDLTMATHKLPLTQRRPGNEFQCISALNTSGNS